MKIKYMAALLLISILTIGFLRVRPRSGKLFEYRKLEDIKTFPKTVYIEWLGIKNSTSTTQL